MHGYENKNNKQSIDSKKYDNGLFAGAFNPKNTYIGKVGSKDKNIDHLHLNHEGKVGRHGTRYLSSV